MAINRQNLIDELAMGHPDTGAYSVVDSEALAQLKVLNRPSAANIEALRNYWLLEEKNDESLFGRLAIVADSAVGDDPIGETTVLTLLHITAAKAMRAIVTPASGFTLDLSDSRFDNLLNQLAGGSGCKVIQPADKTAIQALSLGQISREQEVNIGNTKLGHIKDVRS